MKSVKIDSPPKYTYSDYLNWEGRWELIGGYPYAMMPLPVIEHQKVSGNIHGQLSRLLEDCPKCAPLLPVDWKIDEATVLQPDNMVVCEKVAGKYLSIPPTMIFEILSPATRSKDQNIKYKIYESQKVKYYIIVDIHAGLSKIFQLIDGSYEKLKDARKDEVAFDLSGCHINFNFEKIW